MAGRNTNIYFQEETYKRLRQVTGEKISKFVNEAVEEKLQKQKKEFQKKLAEAYQRTAKSKAMKEESKI